MANIPPFNRAENALLDDGVAIGQAQNPQLVENVEERSEVQQQFYDGLVRDAKDLYISQKFDSDTSPAEQQYFDNAYPAFHDPRRAYVDRELENQKRLAYILLDGPKTDEDYELVVQVIRGEYIPETDLFLTRKLEQPRNRGYFNWRKAEHQNPMNVIDPRNLSVRWQLGEGADPANYMARTGLPWNEYSTWIDDFAAALKRAEKLNKD